MKDGYVETQQALADLLGFSRRTIRKYIKKQGMPGKDEEGRYHVPSCVEWLMERAAQESGGGAAGDQTEATQALTELRKERRRKEKIKNDQLEERLVESEAVRAFLSRLAAHFRQVFRDAERVGGEEVGDILEGGIQEMQRMQAASPVRPPEDRQSLRERIEELRGPGRTYQWIADQLGVTRDVVVGVIDAPSEVEDDG